MPSLETLIAALILLPSGLLLVAALLVLLLHPLASPVLRAVERGRFARRLARAARVDGLLRAGRIDAALREIELAFCLFTVRADPHLSDQIAGHHTGLLSRVLTILEDLPHGRVRLLSLAKVDRILQRRADLTTALFRLGSRSWRDGRRIQLERELRRTAHDLRAAVRELSADVQVLAARRHAVQ